MGVPGQVDDVDVVGVDPVSGGTQYRGGVGAGQDGGGELAWVGAR